MVCLLIMLFIHFCINLIVYQLFLLVLACLSIRIFLSNFWCLNQIFWGKPEDPVFSVMHKGNSYKLCEGLRDSPIVKNRNFNEGFIVANVFPVLFY